jgi:Mg2+/citrate symporter
MMEIIIYSLGKIIVPLIIIVFWALGAVNREIYKNKIIKDAILAHILKYPYPDRLLYSHQTDDFMKENHPLKITFWDEMWKNSLKPLLALVVACLLLYHTIIVYIIFATIFAAVLVIYYPRLDELKTEKWFKSLVSALWISTFLIIVFSEYSIKKNLTQKAPQETNKTEQKST